MSSLPGEAGGVFGPELPTQDTARARAPAAQDTTRRPQAGQDTTRSAAAPQDTTSRDSVSQDTAATTIAQDSVVPPPGLKLGLATFPLPYEVDFISRLPDPAQRNVVFRSRVRNGGDEWTARVRGSSLSRRQAMWSGSRPIAAHAAPEVEAEDVGVFEDSLFAEFESPEDLGMVEGSDLLPDVFGEYADLGIAISGRVEMGGGWSRFRPCNATIVNCSPSLIPNLKPDIQFGARIGGTITDRIHVSVDYDNRREFDAANNINVFYQGLEDEILQRIEVGDVSFALPQSRYLTQGIPSGNFGIRATGQMGPVDFQTVWAQQKGDLGVRELQLGGGGQGFEQTSVTVLDDADYEKGRFYFLFNPNRLDGAPHIDVQELIPSDAPVDVRPNSTVKVYRYEPLGFGVNAQVPEGFITAVAVATDTILTSSGTDTVVTDTLTGLFRPLVDGEDYRLHRSGLWLILRNILTPAEGLAVTYVAANGEPIGTFNAEQQSDAHQADPDNVPPPTLELIRGINQRPGTATWTRELHNVYRVSASPGVVETSVELIISQGRPEVGNTFRVASGQQLEFLKIFGLDDDPTDNLLDLSQVFQLSGAGTGEISGPVGTYIIPPTLEPFKFPAPLKNVSAALDGQPFPLEPGDRNATIYDEPNDVIRIGTNLYLLTISFRQRFEGFLSSISLAPGMREDSERLVIDDVELIRGEDYIVDYEGGFVELRDPERWFRDNPQANVRATWEQKPLFQLAPTSVFGLAVRYLVGRNGEFNFIGLSQSERTLQTRPEIGLEPSSVLLTGFSGRLQFEPSWLSDVVDALPGIEAEAPSFLSLDGEIALSNPNTNTQGATYVEDFEGGTGFNLLLNSRAWRLGAVPSTTAGAESVLPLVMNEENAAELVWQDQFSTEDGSVAGPIPAGDIDDELRLQGGRGTTTEPVMTMSLRMPENRQLSPNPNPPPGPAWASITNPISISGQDFTTIEFLEFYVATTQEVAESLTLVLDLGTVSEDAFAIDSLGSPSGISELNREVVPPAVWSNLDDTGLWGTGCEAVPGQITYPLGDVAANCTRSNGIEDSEDLNQNSILDLEERFFRYTVPLAPGSRYYVRDANDFGGATFRLYRVPLLQADHQERVTEAEFQNVRQLRITVTGQQDARLLLTRMRFLGSRWLKRSQTGLQQGLVDTTTVANPNALVQVGPISTLDPRYVSPPGVTEEAASQSDEFNPTAQQVNEQSLAISFEELGADERAEVYLQYAQVPRDFLTYRSLRLWAMGIEGPWGTGGEPLRFMVKLGEDASNVYLYRTTLPAVPPEATGQELAQFWLPEIRIDMNVFIALRTAAEEILLLQGGLPQDSVLELWDVDVLEDADSSYAVFIGQRSRAANLAAVRQISLSIHNSGTQTVSGGLWVNDIRLDAPTDQTGVIGRFDLDLRASDVLDLSFGYSTENPYFRQLGEHPSFGSSMQYNVGGALRMGKFAPESWRLNMPLTVGYTNASSQPVLLPSMDISGERLPRLRTAATEGLRVDLQLNRQPGGDRPFMGWFLDNSALRVTYEDRRSRTARSETEADGYSFNYNFRSDVADLSFPFFPGKDWRFRLTPLSVQFNANYIDTKSVTKRFAEIISLPEDSLVQPIKALDNRLQMNTGMNFELVPSLTGNFALVQAREIAPTGFLVKGNQARELINAERTEFLGLDLGWMTGQDINMNWTWRPNVTTWLTPQASIDSRFRFTRGASYVVELAGDTVLTSDFDNSRALRASVGFNLPVMLRTMFGLEAGGVLGGFMDVMDRLDLVSFGWTGTLASQYQRQDATPSVKYRFGLGDFRSFLLQEGDTAARVADTEGMNISSGFRFPGGLGLVVDYVNNNSLVWTPVTRTLNDGVTWPNITLNWARLPVPASFEPWVAAASFRVGYSVRSASSLVPRADQLRESEVVTIPLSFNLALTTEWSLSYTLDWSEEERLDPVGRTQGDRRNHTVQITGRFSPLSQQGRFRHPIRISLRFSQDKQDQCRQLGNPFEPSDGTAAQALCEPFIDLRIRRVDLTVGTDMPPFVLGLQGSWRDTQSQIGQSPGNTQLEFSFFGQFLLETGEIR